MIIILVEFIDQLINHLINCASLSLYIVRIKLLLYLWNIYLPVYIYFTYPKYWHTLSPYPVGNPGDQMTRYTEFVTIFSSA